VEALACIQLAIKVDAISMICFLLNFSRRKLNISFKVSTATSLKMAAFWDVVTWFLEDTG
jgi:hypothetical protein